MRGAGLARVGVVAVALAAGPAFGESPPDLLSDGLIQLVPTPPITGGGPSVDLFLIALNRDGTPATGLSLKATRTVGMESRWIEVGNGVYRMPYTPPAVDQPSMVVATAKGKLLTSGDRLSLSAPIQLEPPSAALAVTATPPALVLGHDPQSALQITGAPHGIRMLASAGSVEGLTPGANGAETARYAPPSVNYPQVAILAWADASNPLGSHGFTALPLSGSVEYPVKADPGASVQLEIQGKKYGPVTAGADGKAKVPIEVPPGATTATQITTVNGQEKREDLDLKIPETRRIQLMPLPSSLPADPGASVPLRVVVERPGGGGDPDAKPVFTVSSGSVSAASAKGDGVYEAIWHPAETPGAADVTVSLGGDVQVDKVSTNLVSPRAGAIALSSSVASISADTRAFEVTAKVTDTSGGPMSGAHLVFDLTGADQAGQVVDAGGGTYTVTLMPGPSGPVEVHARLAPMPSTEPVHGIVLQPSKRTVHDDGSDAVDLLVAAVDAQGLPISDVAISLDVVQGDGTIEAKSVTTGNDGTAHARYVAGKTPALVGIRGTAGDVRAITAVLQVPAGVPDVALPAGPTVDPARFTAPVPSITIPRASSVASGPAAEIATIRLASDAATARAGGTLTITVSPLDASGALTPASPPDVVVTGGQVGARTVNGDGSIVVAVTVPDPATVPVTVTAKSGEIVQTLTVPPEAGSGATTAVASSEPVMPVPVPVEPAHPPREPAEVPWMRLLVLGMGSTYRYEQSPTADSGPLLPSRLVVGGPDGGSAAAPVGGEIDFRGWADRANLPYLGLHAQFRAGSYGISASAFTKTARDVLTNSELDLLGRWPVDVNGERYWIGGKVGIHDNDFMAFEGCLDPGCPITTSGINVIGLAVGAEVGADVGKLNFVGGYTLGLAQFSQPYSNALDLDLGYEVVHPLLVDAGFSMLSRSVILRGADSGVDRGALTDSQVMFKLGAGVAF